MVVLLIFEVICKYSLVQTQTFAEGRWVFCSTNQRMGEEIFVCL